MLEVGRVEIITGDIRNCIVYIPSPGDYTLESISHWGLFKKIFTGYHNIHVTGRDERGRVIEENIRQPTYQYEPMRSEDIDGERRYFKRISGVACAV